MLKAIADNKIVQNIVEKIMATSIFSFVHNAFNAVVYRVGETQDYELKGTIALPYKCGFLITF